ncbi:LOW QUALITY PROTEIN: feather keratin Cos2-3-like [Egretta garzetta]|uniref:LOW QUALITY PROTEIN: feather keratin Cos2-3-like n=1 Tax=Egretta garzetta TaxID=188379 RepID=UPI00163C5450|nr:LOW QUALITY PROTEIN: feather keratin Cos2-3-like [Egretta garzetta]
MSLSEENHLSKGCLWSLGRQRSTMKASPAPRSLIPFSCLLLLGSQVNLLTQDMSCYDQCRPCQPCQPCGPTPLANSCNEPCVRQCQNSTVVIEPSRILSCVGVPIPSGCCDLSCIPSRSCGSRCRPC